MPIAPFAPSGVSLRSTSSSPRSSRVALLRSLFAYAVSGSRTMNSTTFHPSSVCLHPRPLITHSESQHRNSAPQLLATQIVQFDHVTPLAESVPCILHSTRSAAGAPFSSLHNLLAALPRLASSPPSGRAAPGLRDRMRSSASSGTQPDTPSLRISLTPSRSNSSVLHYAPNAALRTAAPITCPTAARGGTLADTATQSPLARTDGRLPMAPVTLAMERQPSVLDRTVSHKLPHKTPRGFPRHAPKGCRPPAAWPTRPGG